jgi:hypothetical protein
MNEAETLFVACVSRPTTTWWTCSSAWCGMPGIMP